MRKKHIIKRILLLGGVFIASLIAFIQLLNMHEVISTQNISTATLPILYIRQDSVLENRMVGYIHEINESSLRKNICLLPSSKTISVSIDPFKAKISDVGYQIKDFRTKETLENGIIKDFTEDQGYKTAQFQIKKPLNLNQEYSLRFDVKVEGKGTVYYYSRIVQRNGQSLGDYIKYADAFYQNCISKNLTAEMVTQFETTSSQVNSSLHLVTLKSDKKQIAWGDMTVALERKAVPTVLEVNETTVSLRLDYLVSGENEDRVKEYYAVSDFYRMRKNQDTIVLLDYERSASEYFDPQIAPVSGNALDLGVIGKNVNYIANDTSDIIAFVQGGELWQYDRNANKVIKIFGFRESDHKDYRIDCEDFNISLSGINGSETTFMVYGYMAAGEHEGELGISLYKYDSDINTTHEILFIPMKDSFDLSSQGLAKLSYINRNNQCFLFFDDTIYKINVEEATAEVLQDNISWQQVSVSDSQMRVAWNKPDDGTGESSVCELNLETGETVAIIAPMEDRIKILQYVGEDIIYGLAHSGDCSVDKMGNEIFPMYRVCIRNTMGETLKDYQAEGAYVTAFERQDDLIILKRAQNNGGVLKPIEDDQLIHYAPTEEKKIDIKLTINSRKGTEVNLSFRATSQGSNLLSGYTKYPANREATVLTMDDMVYDKEYYYIYAKGGLYGIYTTISQAINVANEEYGVVMDNNQSYIWERGNLKESKILEVDSLPDGITNVPTDEEALQKLLPEGYQVLSLKGCTIGSIRYQLSNGYPVIGKFADGEYKLILGYDQYENIWIYDKGENKAKALSIEDATAGFETFGNIFISYRQ